MVIVDTSIWIAAFRTRPSQERHEVDALLSAGEVAIIGPVLAELLQGTRNQDEFESLHERLSALPYIEGDHDTWAASGKLSYQLRQEGTSIPLMDVFIATLAMEGGHKLYTQDKHFLRIPGLQLYEPER